MPQPLELLLQHCDVALHEEDAKVKNADRDNGIVNELADQHPLGPPVSCTDEYKG